MNNNSKKRRRLALKNYHSKVKQESTVFEIPNSRREVRVQTIAIGTLPRIKKHAKVAYKV